jgi:ribosome-associated toxin RatA of RatAB toxin-antitoxin module
MSKQVKWTERDHWDADGLSCKFELVEGDMKTYDGLWTFSEADGSCNVELNVNFELGIALLGPMIGKIVDQLMQQNCDELLEALEKLSAQAQAG